MLAGRVGQQLAGDGENVGDLQRPGLSLGCPRPRRGRCGLCAAWRRRRLVELDREASDLVQSGQLPFERADLGFDGEQHLALRVCPWHVFSSIVLRGRFEPHGRAGPARAPVWRLAPTVQRLAHCERACPRYPSTFGPGGWHPIAIRCLREREPVAVRAKRLIAGAQKRGDALQVVEHRELARRVVPLSRVVAVDPCRERCERLDLDLVRPPARPERQRVALAQRADVGPQPLEPQPALAGVEPAPVQRPAWGEHLVGVVAELVPPCVVRV